MIIPPSTCTLSPRSAVTLLNESEKLDPTIPTVNPTGKPHLASLADLCVS